MNILIFAPNWLGDLIMSFAFLKNIKKVFKDSKVYILVKHNLSNLINSFREFKDFKIIEFEDNNKPFDIAKIVKNEIHDINFDYFFALPNSFASGLAGFLIGATNRIGYKNEFRSIFLTRAIKKKLEFHQVKRYGYLLSEFYSLWDILDIHVKIDSESLCKRLNENFIKKLYELYKKYNDDKFFIASCEELHSYLTMNRYNSFENKEIIEKFKSLFNKKFVIVNTVTEGIGRKLQYEKFIYILNKLYEKDNSLLFLFTGLKKDTQYVERIYKKVIGDKMNFCGKTTLEDLIYLTALTDFVITVDSGPSHLANALGKKEVVFFGKYNPMVSGPFHRENVMVIRAENLDKKASRAKWMDAIDEKKATEKIMYFL